MIVNRQPYKYSSVEVDQFVTDINKRIDIFAQFQSALQKRIKLQYYYSEKLLQIASGSTIMKDKYRPSEIFYNSFLKAIEEESKSSTKFGKQLQNELMTKIKLFNQTCQGQTKKYIMLGKSMKKDLQGEFQTLQKNKGKFLKENNELEKLKVEYIVQILAADRDLEKKNKIFLKIKKLEGESFPYKRDYEYLSTKYNQSAETYAIRMNEILSKLQQNQIKRVQLMKSTVINMQIFKSAFGACLIHDTQQILSAVDEVAIRNVQIFLRSQKQFLEEKQILAKPFFNPSQYTDQLFKKVQDKSIDEIMKYGQSIQYKSELSQCFQIQKIQDIKVKVLTKNTIKIIEIFKTVFQGKKNPKILIKQFQELIKNAPTLRKDFILCLQKYRLQGKFQIHQNNLEAIINILNIYLTTCKNQFDTYNSKQFMVLSLTYYFKNQKGQKKDIQEFVKDHPIWKNIRWWECSLLQSIYQESKVKIKKNQSIISIWDIKGAAIKKSDSSEELTISNIAFNQLTYYVHNMSLFGIQSFQISGYATKYIKWLGIGSKMAKDILLMCPSQFKTVILDQKQKPDKKGFLSFI